MYLSRHWLKASISLTLVMGIAWLANLIVFLEELVAVAYIMTIFIAGQGILLFIILVPLSKHVRMYILYNIILCMYVCMFLYICVYVHVWMNIYIMYMHVHILYVHIILYVYLFCSGERHIWSFGVKNKINMSFLVNSHLVLDHQVSVVNQWVTWQSHDINVYDLQL